MCVVMMSQFYRLQKSRCQQPNTDKAFWHNFDLLNSKMLVTKLDFEY